MEVGIWIAHNHAVVSFSLIQISLAVGSVSPDLRLEHTNVHKQVLTAFLLSTTLTVLATIIAANMHGDLLLTTKLVRLNGDKKLFWLRVLDRLILGFSDQQLATGISIILIGLFSICRISSYHFYVINNLGMFSCSSHLASVLSLRRYFQANPVVAKIRIIAMLFSAILLSTSLMLLGFIPVDVDLRCNVACSIDSALATERFLAAFMILYLALAYNAALAYVFPNAEVHFMTCFITKPAQWVESVLGPMGWGYQFHERFMHARVLPALTISFVLQFFWWVMSFAICIYVRIQGSKSVQGTEAVWTFGQMLALLMISLPFLTATEIFWGWCFSMSMTLQRPGLIKGRREKERTRTGLGWDCSQSAWPSRRCESIGSSISWCKKRLARVFRKCSRYNSKCPLRANIKVSECFELERALLSDQPISSVRLREKILV